MVVSVSRKDQFCQSLSNRLGIADVCGLHVAFPYSNGFSQANSSYATAQAMGRLAGAMPADGFSRGSEVPVALADPTLFYRAASELICESIAPTVVDGTNSPFTSSNLDASIDSMVQTIMGYASGDPKYASAIQILPTTTTPRPCPATTPRKRYNPRSPWPANRRPPFRSASERDEIMTKPVLTRRKRSPLRHLRIRLRRLKAIATGLPAWFIANPRKATAADLACAIDARENLQYLIMNVSSMGDPISCNCPGTYDGDAAAAIHPDDATMAPVAITLGSKQYTAATPWNTLLDSAKSRVNFFHHVTLANNHGDQPKVSRLMGATQNGEMLVSAYAEHLSGCLGTVQPEPWRSALAATRASSSATRGARCRLSRRLSFGSSSRAPRARASAAWAVLVRARAAPLVQLRSIRDTYLDKLNDLAKTDATGVQKKFLDALSQSQQQVRSLGDSLATLLGSITADDVQGQALAAAALIAANVTSVVTVKIDFGGDNHSDSNLANEVAAHTDTKRGVAGINMVLQALIDNNLQDKVTFSTMNVFGRNLNGISKTESKAGRDHYGNHSVAVMIGKNVAPGVTGGVTNVTGGFGSSSSSALGAGDIDSASGSQVTGGDVARTDTHVAMGAHARRGARHPPIGDGHEPRPGRRWQGDPGDADLRPDLRSRRQTRARSPAPDARRGAVRCARVVF